MSTQVKLRRGTSLEHETFTGANAELTVDITEQELVLHDGVTPGGKRIGRLNNIMDFIPIAEHKKILDHTTTYNCTTAILQAIAAEPANTGAIVFPAGLFITDMIDVRTYKNIAFIGADTATMYPYTVTGMTVLRAANPADAVILTASLDQNSYDTGASAFGCTVKNIVIDCVNRTQVGITAARNTWIENCTVQNAILDGITLEYGTFPVWIKKVFSRNNGRDGVRVKAPYTTIFNIEDSELSYNGGNGCTILDGSTSGLKNVWAQSNAGYGFEVRKDVDTVPEHPIFLEKILFERCYTEANGDYGLKVHSYNTDPSTFIGKIPELTFVNCAFNSGIGKQTSITGTAYLSSVSTINMELDPSTNCTYVAETRIPYKLLPLEGINLSEGNTSAGVRFPTIPVKESNPYTLDEYKEGVLSPAIGQIGSPFTDNSTNDSFYQIVGNTVHYSFNLAWSDKGSAAAPFRCIIETPVPTNAISGAVAVRLTGGSLSDTWSVQCNSSYGLILLKNEETSGATVGDLPSAGTLSGQITYRKA